MANNILITYATHSGSTAEVAQTIAQTLGTDGATVDVKPLSDVGSLDAYDAVILGAPMILGWHRDAVSWLSANQAALSQKHTALFITCLELTRTDADNIAGVPLFQDPELGHAPKNPAKLSFKERHGDPNGYLPPVFEQAPQVKPVSVGIFGGKLDYGTLGFFPKLFVRFIIRGIAGDYRNWDAIKSWAADIREQFASAN